MSTAFHSFAADPEKSFSQATFPLHVASTGRYLEDSSGKPFLYQADTAWMLFFGVNDADARDYMANRKAQGFNVIQVQLTGFLGMKNIDGELPFDQQNHLQSPNEKFFSHVDRVVKHAEELNMVLAMTPAWAGCCGEGWAGKDQDGQPKPLNRDGKQVCREYGRYLGKRYGSRTNVMWILGGDIDSHAAPDEMREIGLGLKDTAPNQLITYHASSSHSSTDVWPQNEPWLDVSMVYTYFRGFDKAWNKNQPDVYEISHAEYGRMPTRPYILGESTYEGEHGAWGSALQARKQAYWAMLGGCCGHAYGSPNWRLPADWREIQKLPGADDLGYLRLFFESHPWWTLEPDIDHQWLRNSPALNKDNDSVVAALSKDKSFGVVYLPSKRRFTVNSTLMGTDQIKVTWFNPRTGAYQPSETVRAQDNLEQESPDNEDWVVLFESVK
jgi:hypothetical protein